MIKGTKQEFENLADYILHDYFGQDYDVRNGGHTP